MRSLADGTGAERATGTVSGAPAPTTSGPLFGEAPRNRPLLPLKLSSLVLWVIAFLLWTHLRRSEDTRCAAVKTEQDEKE